MIPLTFEQAVDLYGKVKGLTPASLRLMVDDYADQMELFASVAIVLGDKLLEAEQALDATNTVNTRLTAVVSMWTQLTPAELRAEADRRSARPPKPAPPDAIAWRGTSDDFENPALREHLANEFGAFLAAHDEARAESEAKHPSNYVETTSSEATESGEIDPDRE